MLQHSSRLYEALPWYLAVNQPETLANLYINNEQYDEAVVIAQVSAVGGYDELTSAGGASRRPARGGGGGGGGEADKRSARQQLHVIRSAMADNYAGKGEAVS